MCVESFDTQSRIKIMLLLLLLCGVFFLMVKELNTKYVSSYYLNRIVIDLLEQYSALSVSIS